MPHPDPIPADVLRKFERASGHHYLPSLATFVRSKIYFASSSATRSVNFASSPELIIKPGERTDINLLVPGSLVYGATPGIGAQVASITTICPRATEAPWIAIRFGACKGDPILYVVPDPDFATRYAPVWSLHARGIDVYSCPGGIKSETYITESVDPICGSIEIPADRGQLVRY